MGKYNENLWGRLPHESIKYYPKSEIADLRAGIRERMIATGDQ